MLLPSCSDEDRALQTSGKEIILDVAEWEPLAKSRATVYNSETFTDHSKHGGEFSLYAYVGETDKAYLNGARVWCREDGDWGFITADDAGSAIKYYWPASEHQHLTFFACMPRDLSATGVTLEAYTAAGGQKLSCKLPEKIVFDGQGLNKDDNKDYSDYKDDSGLREFICAYTPDKFKEDVTMHFVHPFAVVDLIVTEAPVDLTLQSVTFKNIYREGTCTFNAYTGDPATAINWTPPGDASRSSCEIRIDRVVPNNEDLNLHAPIGGPYIVMPQTLNAGVTMDLTYQLGETEPKTSSISIADGTDDVWKAGNKYTYALKFGQNGADLDVSLKVAVDQWEKNNYEHNVEVE